MANIIDRFNTEEEVDLQQMMYLTFIIDKQFYAFSVKDVIEIIEIQDITSVPEAPDYVKGIINVRGRIIPIIDVRRRFHKPDAPYTERTCIVVANINDKDIGFVVDTVDEVIEFEEADISPAPTVYSDHSSKFITGVGKIESKIVILLDPNKLLNEQEVSDLSKLG